MGTYILIAFGIAVLTMVLVIMVGSISALRSRVRRLEKDIRALRSRTIPQVELSALPPVAEKAPEAVPPKEEASTVESEEEPPPLPARQAGRVEPAGDRSPKEPEPAVDTSPSDAPPPRTSPLAEEPVSHPTEFDWERWVGVRGAAVVGGIALVFAGLFFVQVAIERGWLGPAARDALSFGLGALGLLAHGPLRKRGLNALADSVGGAGAVLMYGGAWAAAQLHDLVSTPVALAAMGATTAAALWVAVRANAPIVATFALAGGFATPLLLGTTDADSTWTLIGYVIVLDLALVALGRRQSWKFMLPVAICGTALLQFVWGETNLGAPLALWVMGVFMVLPALLFSAVISGGLEDTEVRHGGPGERAHFLQLVALLLPFGLLLRQVIPTLPADVSLWTVGAIAATLSVAAGMATARLSSALYLGVAGLGSAALLLAFGARGRIHFHPVGEGANWDPIDVQWWVVSLLLGTLLLALTRLRGAGPAARAGAYWFALPSLLFCSAAIPFGSAPEASRHLFLGLVAGLSLIGCLGATFTKKGAAAASVLAVATGLSLLIAANLRSVDLDYRAVGLLERFRGANLWHGPALAAAFAVVGSWLRAPKSFAAFGALVALPSFIEVGDSARLGEGTTLAVGAAIAAASALGCAILIRRSSDGRQGMGTLLVAAAVTGGTALLAIHRWGLVTNLQGNFEGFRGLTVPVACGLMALLLGAMPLAVWVMVRRHGAQLTGLGQVIIAAAALPLLSLSARPEFLGATLFQLPAPSPRGMHGLLLAGATFSGAFGLPIDGRHRGAAIPFFGVAAALAATSLVRGVSDVPLVTGTAVTLGALALLCARASRWRLGAVVGAASLVPALLLLVVTFVLSSFRATESVLPLQISIEFALVIGSTIAVAAGLKKLEPLVPLADANDENWITPLRYATVAAAIALLFGWMNAAVLNRFTEAGTPLEIQSEALQARDLTLSISWALFAGGLLLAGMLRRIPSLRWTSLVLFVVVILKVFLHDLGFLTGLSRVASFLGLAVSLLGVSLLYSRLLGTEEKRDRSEP